MKNEPLSGTDAAEEFVEHLRRHREWSMRTFGPGCRTVGLTRHIEKECEEIRNDPSDLTEWVDILILGIDGYWRAGGDMNELMERLNQKQAENFLRKWPTNTDESKPTEHIHD